MMKPKKNKNLSKGCQQEESHTNNQKWRTNSKNTQEPERKPTTQITTRNEHTRRWQRESKHQIQSEQEGNPSLNPERQERTSKQHTPQTLR